MEKVKQTMYVIRTRTSGTTLYLRLEPTGREYELTEDLLKASKCPNKSTARLMLNYYFQVSESGFHFDIIPVKVTYETDE